MAIDEALMGIISDRVEEVLGSEIAQELRATWAFDRGARELLDQAAEGPLQHIVIGPRMPMIHFLGEVIRLAEQAVIADPSDQAHFARWPVNTDPNWMPVYRANPPAVLEPIIPEFLEQRLPEFVTAVRDWTSGHQDVNTVEVRTANLNPQLVQVVLRRIEGNREHGALWEVETWRLDQAAGITLFVWDNLNRTRARLRQQIKRT
jgi:hypothetical protein